MRCKTVCKLMTDFVDGSLKRGREGRVRGHLAGCGCCREEEDLHRTVVTALADVPEVPPPEDGFHRLETRLAFLPPSMEARPADRLRTLALPYAAGLATAAVLLLFVVPLFEGPGASPGTGAPAEQAGPLAGGPGIPALLPGERELTPVSSYPRSRYVVDERGRLRELSPGDWMRLEQERRRASGGVPPGMLRPVDAEER